MLSGSAAKSAIAIVLVVVLFLTACQPSTLISALDAVVTAAEIALPIIGSTAGIPPAVMSGIVSYLQAVDVAIHQTSVILAGPGTAADKAAQILAAFAGTAAGCNCIPPGTPQVVVSVIQAVANAIAKFLAQFAQPSLLASDHAIKITRADRAALAKIRTRAEQNLSKLKDLKK